MLFNIFLLAVLSAMCACLNRTYTMTGIFQCRGKPSAHQPLELKLSQLLFKGRTAAKVYTGNDGRFTIKASTKARSWQRAYGWVQHSCDKKNRKRCDIKTYIPIPRKFKDKTYNLGVFELSTKVYYNSCDDQDN